MIEILAAIALTLGGLISALNWYTVYASYKEKRFVSAVPLIGGPLLVIGLLGFSSTRHYAWAGMLADYGTLITFFALPMLLREAWQTSRFNLVHELKGEQDGRSYDIRLFKRGIFTMRCEYKAPAPCDRHRRSFLSLGAVGHWRGDNDGFWLESYYGDRTLEIRKVGDHYATKELNYPADKEFKDDCFDSIELTKVK